MDNGDFIDLSKGAGPPRQGGAPAGRGVPPPPPRQQQGGYPGQGRPNVVNVNPGPQNTQPRPMQSQQIAPPPPPREIVPVRLQQGPRVQVSDIRKERLTDSEAREELSTYTVFRFERADPPDGYDAEGEKVKPTWENVIRSEVHDIAKKDVLHQIRFLNETTLPIGEKKASLNPAQQRQLEKAQEELSNREHDARFQTVLVQMDHQLKVKVLNRSTERERVGGRHGDKGERRRPKEYRDRKGKEYWGNTSTYSKRKASGSKDGKKKGKERVSITAYYKRSPRPEVDAIAIVMQREAEMARRLQPPHPQQILPPQQVFHPQQYPQQYPQQHPQQHPQHPPHNQQPMPRGPPPPPPGPRGPPPFGPKGMPPKPGGGGPAPVQIVKDKKFDKKHPAPHSPSSSRTSGFSDTDDSSDEDDISIQTPASSNTSSGPSYNPKGSRGPKKGSRYIEEPSHYGVRARLEPHKTRGQGEHRISDELLPGVPPSPLIPRYAPLPSLPSLPPVDLEQLKADFYEAGRADATAEAHERVVEQLARPRIIQRQRQLSDRPLHASDVVVLEEDPLLPAPRPRQRLLQRRPSVRLVRPGNIDLLEQEAIGRLENIRFDDERRYEDPRYPADFDDEYGGRVERRRVRDVGARLREDRIREELAREREDELREAELRDEEIREDILAREREREREMEMDREYGIPDYPRRRQPAPEASFRDGIDPANPFAPRRALPRRVTVAYSPRRYD
ncbi:hypothetical protein QBC33DRAFT_352967 [Phialemonium atrogriseum]|uniref:Uncharacterized protein n=1 Tax=Phialemonium atrogriseum TaxID=1093897 RepID=A0AAJ0FNK1_9PEZI|nr:uncharacterized protein QBC33DRAFT_352967 [Phialemonium atrogriseum]KAK1769363.1 hypothetical protein QBC33DRAFT_352967 [Phialemonium atrogriseum]